MRYKPDHDPRYFDDPTPEPADMLAEADPADLIEALERTGIFRARLTDLLHRELNNYEG